MIAPRVVVVGDIMVDVTALLAVDVVRGSDAPAAIRIGWGGSGANTAAWLASSGTPTAFVGRVGADAFGRAAIDELTGVGVVAHVGIDPDRPTGTCIVLVHADGERSMLPDPGANSGLLARHLPALRPDTGLAHLHLSGYTLLNAESREAGRAALNAAETAGLTMSVDVSSVAPLAAVGPETFLDWTRGVGLLFANTAEARLLSGSSDPVAAARHLAGDDRETVVKLGAAGTLWCGPSGRIARTGQMVRTRAIDTTGAGDAFTAGYLGSRLSGGDPTAALAAGATLAAQAVTQVGARPRAL